MGLKGKNEDIQAAKQVNDHNQQAQHPILSGQTRQSSKVRRKQLYLCKCMV